MSLPTSTSKPLKSASCGRADLERRIRRVGADQQRPLVDRLHVGGAAARLRARVSELSSLPHPAATSPSANTATSPITSQSRVPLIRVLPSLPDCLWLLWSLGPCERSAKYRSDGLVQAPDRDPGVAVELVVEAELLAPARRAPRPRPAAGRRRGSPSPRRQPRPELQQRRVAAALDLRLARRGPVDQQQLDPVGHRSQRPRGHTSQRRLAAWARSGASTTTAEPSNPSSSNRARVASANRGSCSRLVTRASAERAQPPSDGHRAGPGPTLDDDPPPALDLAEHDTQPLL